MNTSQNFYFVHAMVWVVSCHSVTGQFCAQFQVSPCGMCDGQSGIEADFNLNTSVVLYHSTRAPY